LLKVIELGSYAIQVTNTVVVAVRKTSWINFVKDCVLPPLVTFGIYRFGLRAKFRRQPGRQE
jgi:hypothetical protein